MRYLRTAYSGVADKMEPPVEVYGERIPWEIPVQLCIKDFLCPGDCAFDVGANIGGISLAMSRLVGPAGRVYAFEANPLLIPRLERQLLGNHACNVTVVPRAAWSITGELRTLYCDPSHYAFASSLVHRLPAATEALVETVTLDDYCCLHDLAPRVVKIDVEGAEFQVVRGTQEVIKRYTPIIIFEYYASVARQEDPAEFLQSCGYILYDANLYRQVDRAFYLSHFSSPPLVNLLAIPETRFASSPYFSMGLIPVGTIQGTAELSSEPFPITAPGRYVVRMNIDGPDDKVAALKVTSDGEGVLAYVEARVAQLRQHSCSNMVFEVESPVRIRCEFEPRESGAFVLREAQVLSIGLALAN